jgi:excisionase family DNA binding protein
MENVKTPQRQDSNDEFIFGLNGLMDWLGISKTTAYRMKKKIPHLQIGKTIRFRKADVLKALEKNYQTV